MSKFRQIYDHRGSIASEVIVDADDVITWNTIEDVDPLLNLCKQQRQLSINRKSAFRPIAHVPETVVMTAMREGWFHDTSRWKRWANDSHNRAFRVTEGIM